jgi:hypothetical protein
LQPSVRSPKARQRTASSKWPRRLFNGGSKPGESSGRCATPNHRDHINLCLVETSTSVPSDLEISPRGGVTGTTMYHNKHTRSARRLRRTDDRHVFAQKFECSLVLG